MANLLLLTSQLKGAAFGNIFGYSNDRGEIANYHVNFGMNYGKAKGDDYNTVKSASVSEIAAKVNYPIPMVEKAIADLLKSLNPNTPQSAQGKAQSDAYTVVNSSLKIHNETEALYIYAYVVNKEVIVSGEYGVDTRRAETACKDAVKKALNLKTAKYRQFKIEREKFFAMKMSGEVLVLA